MPLLGVDNTSISCARGGEGTPVTTHEVRKGTKDFAICTSDCAYQVEGLSPATLYEFNVLAHNSLAGGRPERAGGYTS